MSPNTTQSKKRVAFLIVAAAVAAATLYAVRSLTASGYDFSENLDPKLPWVGPPIGERINLSRLKDRREQALGNVAGDRLIMLATIDDRCQAAELAADQLGAVRDGVTRSGVEYYLVTFSSPSPAERFFNFADNLVLGAPAFRWDMENGPPPDALVSIITPSHVLINSKGVILRKWPGTHMDNPVRKRMANQIVSDTAEEISALKFNR